MRFPCLKKKYFWPKKNITAGLHDNIFNAYVMTHSIEMSRFVSTFVKLFFE